MEGGWVRFVRGRPSRDGPGSKLLGLGLPGEVGSAEAGGSIPDGRIGDSGRGWENAGEADRTGMAGDAGRANRETAATDGLAGLGPLAVRRVMPGAGMEVGSTFPCELGPGTRRSRSSSCVLSFDDSWPTRDHTFSPTRL